MSKRKRSNSPSSSSDKKDDESIVAQVHRLWSRLEKHLTEKRPGVLKALNPPATEEEIKEFESKLGYPLPIEFRTLYKLHNGQESQKTEKVEDLLFHPIDFASVWLPLSACETHKEAADLDFLTTNMECLQEEKKRKMEEIKTTKRGKGGKGGKGLNVPTEDNPLNGFVGFISNHEHDDSVSCCGLLLGYHKASASPRVYRWHGEMHDVAELEDKGNFLKWFENAIKEMEILEDSDGDQNKETKEPQNDEEEKEEEQEDQSKLSMKKSTRLSDMNCIITGLFDPHEPQDIADYIIRNGGKISQNVTGTVTHMVLGKPGEIPPYRIKTGKGSKKYREAKKKKRIKTIEFEELQDIINGKKNL